MLKCAHIAGLAVVLSEFFRILKVIHCVVRSFLQLRIAAVDLPKKFHSMKILKIRLRAMQVFE